MDISAPPFWGAQTSYLNFCEEDYVVTRYIAEFVNTLSSLIYVAYGCYGILTTSHKPGAGPRLVLYSGLIGVGLCSGAYHMTLKYHTQMSDELSMHLLTTPLTYRVLAYDASPERSRLFGIILSIVFTVVMVAHMVMDEFLLHAVTFGLEVAIIATRITAMIPQQVPDPLQKKRLQYIARLGCGSFVLGYFVWLLDDWICNLLIDTRQFVGIPFAFFLELHGWWHVFTAIGGYVAVAVVDIITSGEVHEDPTDLFAWPIPAAARFTASILSRNTKATKKV